MGTHPRREVSVEIPGGAIALDRPARPVIALLMDEDRIQEAALCSIARLWPGVGLRELQSHCREWQRVFARYCFAHLLAREAGLGRRSVAELIRWRSASSVAAALNALDDECATNRGHARQLREAVTLFRELLKVPRK